MDDNHIYLKKEKRVYFETCCNNIMQCGKLEVIPLYIIFIIKTTGYDY